MTDGRAGNPVPRDEIAAIFDRIAPVYDAMNTAMTLGLDARWRREAVRVSAISPGSVAVDVACGTGALTRALAAAASPGGSIIGLDSSLAMVRRARRPRRGSGELIPRYLLADALGIPLDDGIADAATIAFGLRNMPDYAECLAELARVTKSGGRVVVLEIATPRNPLGRALAATWFERVVPIIGRAIGAGAPYRYLPASVHGYPAPERVADLMRGAGLADVRWRRLPPGLVTLHVGRRA